MAEVRELESQPNQGDRARNGNKGDRVEEDIADHVKTKTKTWADVVKVLEVDDSKSDNSVRNRSEPESIDSIEMIDLEKSI